ncbi:MAG: hypothetical protein COB20_09550 [SAR86 cluster bacterium]|uniref:Uncharacterized protein n=1 Tax=SAR86 cluster bacterium TaxID=2030880 RepID=A0A2A4X2Q1_9GAMM|nr:MAG: hypothetical protein COB20_09550 [SAR86 cluster bacterium]
MSCASAKSGSVRRPVRELVFNLDNSGKTLIINIIERSTFSREATRTALFQLFLVFSLLSCNALDTTVKDPVEWWAINSYGASVTMEFYDNNCSRPLRDLKLRANAEVKVVSCGDGQGQANIRYRREGYPSRSDPWSADALLRTNQRVLVR